MRGRQSAGMLRLIGMDELVARDRDDYLAIVARLVRDRPGVSRFGRASRGSPGRLFGRDDAEQALHAFFEAEASG